MNIDNSCVEKIKKLLIEKLEPYIIYIFGSSAKGVFREDSDVDIAFLGDMNLSEYEVFVIAQELADILKREVDLIDLKNASTVFKAQIVGNGEVIYCNDDTRRMYFEMRAFKEYALLNEERENILKNIKERGSVYGE
ncbi:MAG: nucleotidyltransferase domain-containing protein [Clostridiaceae bacterium]|nr:nucleotidyltransferase domain-containing protein [Clostridiaceae bacterium]